MDLSEVRVKVYGNRELEKCSVAYAPGYETHTPFECLIVGLALYLYINIYLFAETLLN